MYAKQLDFHKQLKIKFHNIPTQTKRRISTELLEQENFNAIDALNYVGITITLFNNDSEGMNSVDEAIQALKDASRSIKKKEDEVDEHNPINLLSPKKNDDEKI